MAQPQPPVPEYPHPGVVTDQQRDAVTPERGQDDDGGITTLLYDPVSYHPCGTGALRLSSHSWAGTVGCMRGRVLCAPAYTCVN